MPQLKLVISEVPVVCTNETLTAVDLFDPVTFKTFQNSIKGQHIDLVTLRKFKAQLSHHWVCGFEVSENALSI